MENQNELQTVTDEDLDKFLVAGSEELRGVELIPEVLEHFDLSEFIRGSILSTDYCGANITDDMERDIALARYFLE